MCGRCQGAPLCCICLSSTHLLWASSLGASGSPAPGPRLLSLSCSSVPSIFWDKDSPFTGPDKSAEKRQVGALGAVLTHTTPLQRLGTTRTSTAGCPGTQPSPQHRYPSSGLTKTAIRMAPRLNCPSPEADLSMDFPHCPLQENSYAITSMCSARTDCWARSHQTKEDPSHQLPVQDSPLWVSPHSFISLVPWTTAQRVSQAQKLPQRHSKSGCGH